MWITFTAIEIGNVIEEFVYMKWNIWILLGFIDSIFL